MTAAATRPLLALVVLGVLASLAWAAAGVTWHVAGFASVAPAEAPAPAITAADAPATDIGPALALAPFGTAPPPPAAVRETETALDLVLRGVVVQADPALSSALIGHGSQTDSYRPGDSVADQATLISVATDKVVLDVNGKRETLSFPRVGDAAGAAPAPGGVGALEAAVSAAAVSDAPPTTPEDFINLWRERISANPQDVLDEIGLIPTENGYRIADVHDSGVGRAGLRAGDLVTRVNGQAVGNVEQDRKLYEDVAASGLARIEVQRDGRTIVMSFPLR